jgi:predicted PurR-regulated permease PerM
MRHLSGRQVTFIAVVILISVAFTAVLLPFWGALLWAVVLAILFDPLQQRLVRQFHGRVNLAAATSVLVCVCIVVVPGSLLLGMLAQDANAFYQRLDGRDFDAAGMLRRLFATLPDPVANLLGGFESLRDRANAAASDVARAAASRLLSIGQGTARLLTSIGVMLYVLFFLFRDGAQLVETLRRSSPLSEYNTRCLMEQFTLAIKATVKGNFILAVIQGAVGGLAFWALGIDGALLWGVVMVVLSLLPVIGAALVWMPAAGYLLLSGEYLRGGIMVAVGLLVISLIDNFLRPMLVGKDIRLPDYLVLVTTLGGLVLFGMNGFVIGPLIAALFVAVWSLLKRERDSGWSG